jgi:hypothetical protein
VIGGSGEEDSEGVAGPAEHAAQRRPDELDWRDDTVLRLGRAVEQALWPSGLRRPPL